MQNGKRTLAILGSTGSIGTQTVALLERFPDRFHVTALAAGRRIRDHPRFDRVWLTRPGDIAAHCDGLPAGSVP